MTFDILLSCCCVKSNKVLCKHSKNELVYSWHINYQSCTCILNQLVLSLLFSGSDNWDKLLSSLKFLFASTLSNNSYNDILYLHHYWENLVASSKDGAKVLLLQVYCRDLFADISLKCPLKGYRCQKFSIILCQVSNQ